MIEVSRGGSTFIAERGRIVAGGVWSTLREKWKSVAGRCAIRLGAALRSFSTRDYIGPEPPARNGKTGDLCPGLARRFVGRRAAARVTAPLLAPFDYL